MPFIFENIQTKERRISGIDNTTVPQKAWKWEDAYNKDMWRYGICKYLQHDNHYDIMDDHTVMFWHDDVDRLVAEGLLVIPNTKKIVDNIIVDKTDEELLEQNVITKVQYDRRKFEEAWSFPNERYRLIGNYSVLKQYAGAFMSDLLVKKIINEYNANTNTLSVFLNIIKTEDLASLKQIPTVTIQDFETEQYL